MIRSQSCVINRACPSAKDAIAAYRLLRNEKWGVDDIVKAMASACSENAKGLSHALCIEDTSELNYDNISDRLSADDPDFGPGSEKSLKNSIFLHPCLVVDALGGMPVGFSHVEIWNRERDKSGVPDRHVRPLEEKESYKWVKCALETSSRLPREVRKTMVCDREGDVYESMARFVAAGCGFVVRSRFDRHCDEGYMWEKTLARPVACTYNIEVRRKGEAARTAKMELRYRKVTVKSPRRCPDEIPKELEVTCVYTREIPGTTPDGVEPVDWKLLTSHDVACAADAKRVVQWYAMRWMVEELFSLVKSRGLDVGDAQLESGKAMKKLIVLAVYAALETMVAKEAIDNKREDMPAEVMFSHQQQATLEAIMKSLRKESPKAKGGKNPYRKGTMPWAAWILARLGGWSGYEKSHGKPGYKTLSKGIGAFHIWHHARMSSAPPE